MTMDALGVKICRPVAYYLNIRSEVYGPHQPREVTRTVYI